MATETSASQDGLAYEDSGLDIVPIWTREPSTTAIKKLCRQLLWLPSHAPCSITFYAEGAFNKLYLVQTDEANQSWMMRVSLPVCPFYKTQSEVVTMKWVRKHTDIPIPHILSWEENNDNEIGFEWIVMQKMPGVTAYSRWRRLTMAQKVALTERIAELQSQLFRQKAPGDCLRGIGTLHRVRGPSKLEPGQMVTSHFFIGDHIKYDVPRGPFRSSHDWLKSYLDIISRDGEKTRDAAMDEDEKEDADAMLAVARRLLSLLPKIFPSIQNPAERTALYHHDLGLANILIDEEGKLTAIIDWECVSAMPMWMTTRVPKFLRGKMREEEPKRDTYADETPPASPKSSSKGEIAEPDPDDLDNEGKDSLYWIHLMEYDQTQLQKVYHDKMRSLLPAWDFQVEESKLQCHFYDAMVRCSTGFHLKAILQWMDKIEAGEQADLDVMLVVP